MDVLLVPLDVPSNASATTNKLQLNAGADDSSDDTPLVVKAASSAATASIDSVEIDDRDEGERVVELLERATRDAKEIVVDDSLTIDALTRMCAAATSTSTTTTTTLTTATTATTTTTTTTAARARTLMSSDDEVDDGPATLPTTTKTARVTTTSVVAMPFVVRHVPLGDQVS